MRCKGLWILFLPVLIGLHAMSMSEGSENMAEKNIVYGFTPDRGRWSHYASDPADTIYLYDTKSVLKVNNKVKVWIKFGEPVNDTGDDRFYKEATALKEIECNTRLIRTVEWHYLSVKEKHYQSASPTKWENIEPETADDALLEEVCAQRPKGKNR